MNRELVESATHPQRIGDLLDEKGEQWQRYHSDIGGAEAAKKLLAGLVTLDRNKEYVDTRFPPSDERIMTRLGEDGMVLDFESVCGPFGTSISRITLPAHWSRGLSPGEDVAISHSGGQLKLRVGERRFAYSRVGLEQCRSEAVSAGA